METQNRLSPSSLLYEARNRLRSHIALENALLEVIAQLPEGTDQCDERDALQLGAGRAYLELEQLGVEQYDTKLIRAARGPLETYEETRLDEIMNAFYSTRPKNKHTQQHYFDPLEREAFLTGYHLVTCAATPTQRADVLPGSA